MAYATALFEQGTIARYLAYYYMLLRAMTANDSQPVDQLPMLSPAERQQVLYDWNVTATAYPKQTCLHALFEAQTAKTPDAAAVVYEDASLTYARLNRQANRLAHHLMAMGVRPDTRVAICVERRLEMVVDLLAILKASGAYMPLDPSYPADRLGFMLKDRWKGLPEQVMLIALDAETRPWAQHSASNPDPHETGLTAKHLAYVIYTSGSTGNPKEVMI